MAGRWVAATADEVLKREGVRMIVVDSPGMGGTDRCPVGERIALNMGMFECVIRDVVWETFLALP